MKKTRASALLLCLLAPLAGCAKKGVTGEWDAHKTIGPLTDTAHLSVQPDGHYTLNQKMQAQGRTAVIAETGSYKLEKDAIIWSSASATMNGRPVTLPSGISRTQKFTLDGDHFTVDPDNATARIDYVRAK